VTDRRLLALGVAALLLAGTGIGIATTRDPEITEVATEVAEPPTSTSSTLPAPTATTATSVPATTTSRSPSTTVRVTATTTRMETTTTAARPPITRPPPATTTTRKPPALVACSPADVTVTIVTDRPSYGPGELVTANSTLRNRSGSACTYRGYTFTGEFRDAAGIPWAGGEATADATADVTLAPAEPIVQTMPWHHVLSSAGVCTVVAAWRFAGQTFEVSTTFALT
jgi:hypothetical protein